jgi:methionyl aminopeptidase
MITKDFIMIEAGKIVSEIFSHIESMLQPGTRLKSIDIKVTELLNRHGARSVLFLNGFEGNISTSLNNEVFGGLPDNREVAEGDLVKIDLPLYYRGFFVDKARTFLMPPSHYEKRYLVKAASTCLETAFNFLGPDISISQVGALIENQAKLLGLAISRELSGHYIGDQPHMQPLIPNYKTADLTKLRAGDYIALEPILFYSRHSRIYYRQNLIISNEMNAHIEDTIMITNNGAKVIT